MLRRKKSKADEVKDKATEIQEKAAETIGPKVSDARGAAESAFESVRDDIAPAIRDGVASAISTSDSDDSDDGKKSKKKRGGKLKKLIIISGLGGIAFFVAKKVKDSQSGPPVPPPAPRPTPAPSPATPPRPTDGGDAASTESK